MCILTDVFTEEDFPNKQLSDDTENARGQKRKQDECPSKWALQLKRRVTNL